MVSFAAFASAQNSATNRIVIAGTYQSTANARKNSAPDKIIVTQTADSLQITRFSAEGKPVTNQLRLDGSISDYVTAGGFRGKARLTKSKGDLAIEIAETTMVEGRPIPIHVVERWQLSRDGSMLITRTDVDCPQEQQEEPHTLSGKLYSCTMIFRGYPLTEKYKKISSP
jgi:hypothetical protein